MKRPTMRSSPEFARIETFVTAMDGKSPPEILLGPGDDAAVLNLDPNERLVVSTDLSVEDVHFRREWLTWKAIGYRAVAAAMSDLAAMAARPLGALVSVALAPELDTTVLHELGSGVGDCLRSHKAGLLGGDLSRSPGPAVIDVTVLGMTPRPVGREGARSGDELWVTGRLGGAAAAAASWASGLEPHPSSRERFERPQPRITVATWLAERVDIHAAIDLSDGLTGDAAHLAAASDVALEIRTDIVPLDPVLQGWANPEAALALACGGGEDYELLLCVAPRVMDELAPVMHAELGVELTRIGRVLEGDGVRWIDAGGERLAPAGGFDHFADDA